MRMYAALALVFLCLSTGFSGCGSGGTAPPGGGLEFSFQPAGQALQLLVGQGQEFRVEVSGQGEYAIQWRLDGSTVSQARVYYFNNVAVGNHTVTVTVEHSGAVEFRQWSVDVVENVEALPPAVRNVSVSDGGQGPGTVKVTWTAVAGSMFPVVAYQVAVGYGDHLGEDNWDEATVSVRVEATAEIGYAEILGPEDGIRPGETAWFGVRALDDHGQLSPLPEASSFTVSYPWYFSGRIIDDQGNPLPSVLLKFTSFQGTSSGATDVDGLFVQGPFSSVDSVQVLARAIDPEYYTYQSPRLGASTAAQSYPITMFRNYHADATCNANNGDFLAYLRFMTRSGIYSPDGVLHKWDHYPVTVHVPDFVRAGDGVDFGAMCRQALDLWNVTVNADLLTTVADPAEADVLVSFADVDPGINGQVILTEPAGSLGNVTPVHMTVEVDRNLVGLGDVSTSLAVKGVCLHEFGHVLGLYEHSSCDGYRLMDAGNGTMAFSPDVTEPIAADEINAVRCLRYLPDGVDMDGYDVDELGG